MKHFTSLPIVKICPKKNTPLISFSVAFFYHFAFFNFVHGLDYATVLTAEVLSRVETRQKEPPVAEHRPTRSAAYGERPDLAQAVEQHQSRCACVVHGVRLQNKSWHGLRVSYGDAGHKLPVQLHPFVPRFRKSK